MSIDFLLGYVVLSIIAFCDTLIGVGFVVFSELAFLAAGGPSQQGETFFCWFFAWGGDMVSYQIGSRYGLHLSLRYFNKQRRKAWRRAQLAHESYGTSFVILSRLLSLAVLITTFLAGAMNMPQQKFASAAAVGVFVAGRWTISNLRRS